MSEKDLYLSIDTPLVESAFFVESFSGKENISELYSYTVNAKSEIISLSFEQIVGKPVTLIIELGKNRKRFISGYVNSITQLCRLSDLNHYRIEIVPWLKFLVNRSDCRTFQDKTVLDIVKDVFDTAGFSGKYEIKTEATYRKREYCVQFQETDFNFVSRLMEEEGIYYFFSHTEKSHTLVLCDAPSAHNFLQPSGNVIYNRAAQQNERSPVVMDFIAEHSIRPTMVSLKDFDFTKPGTDLTVEQKKEDKYELYLYPGNYTERHDGEHYAKVRLEYERSLVNVFNGTATDRRLTTGSTFNLTEHPRADYNTTYMITSVNHNGNQKDEELTYNCRFKCIPSDIPFRSQDKKFTRPVIAGCQTALVVGPSGEEVWVDKYGRIKVQFHWDRLGKKDENSSCWIRVARDWAGKNWGFMFHPRIGQEVIVQFVDGDIDRPIVTGSVYNEEQMPPYELPANSTQSTIKSRSSKDGTPDNFNEIRFEDKKGEEHFLIHAEKDHMVEVENDEIHSVGHDETHSVKHNRTTTIDNDDTLTVMHDETITVKNNRTETVEKDETVTIKGNRTHSTDKDYNVTTQKNETRTIDENLEETVAKNATINVKENRTTTITKTDSLVVNKEWLVEVADKVEIKCGQASITLKKDGTVEINGMNITTTGTGKIKLTATGEVKVEGSKVALN